MSTGSEHTAKRVSDERIIELIHRFEITNDNPGVLRDSISLLKELQQRRETDRRIAWEAQRELWIQNAYDNNPLKQAISELLP